MIGFQTLRKGHRNKDASIFDYANVRNVRLFLNSLQFPYSNFETNYSTENYGILYRNFIDFRKSFYGKNDISVDMDTYKNYCPIIVFNTMHTEPLARSTPIDVRLEFEFTSELAEGTNICLLIVQDSIVSYQPLSGTVFRE